METCKTIVLAQPEAGASVNYEIPTNETAQLSFGPDQISGIKLNDFGGLEISFLDGSTATLTNFEALVDSGNLLYLNDGTLIDPSVLTGALGNAADPTENSDILTIVGPADNVTREINLEPGQKYVLDFDFAQPSAAEVQDGKLVISFANDGILVLNNYEEVMNGELPAELSLASSDTIISGEELLTSLTLAEAAPSDDVLAFEEEETEDVRRTEVAEANLEGENAIGAGDEAALAYEVAQVEPASGTDDDLDSIAEALQQVEPAAGETGGASGRGGYGFNSNPGSEPLGSIDDVGPINPTALNYQAPQFSPERLDVEDQGPLSPVDSNPIVSGPFENRLDETNLDSGNLVDSGQVLVDFGTDGPGTISPSGSVEVECSVLNDDLSSGGVDVVISEIIPGYFGGVTGQGYVGTAGGELVFTLVIDPETGEYTYTQFKPFDHADANDANDEICLTFGVVAEDKDGDTTNTEIKVIVADDAPLVLDQATKTHDETDFNGNPAQLMGTFAVDFGQDVDGTITPEGTFTPGGSLAGGVLSSGGDPITVTPTANGYEGKLGDGTVIFTLEVDSSTGDYKFTQYAPLDHEDGANPDDVISLEFDLTVTDFDGDSATGTIRINVVDDAPVIAGPATETIDESDLGPIVENGSVAVDFGEDGAGEVAPNGDFTPGGSLDNGALTSGGEQIVVTQTADGYVGKLPDDSVAFTLEIDPATGDYTFTLLKPLDHADDTNANDIITLEFGVTATDFDGDSAATTITIKVKDDAPEFQPNGPKPDAGLETVDETNLENGNIVETGSLNADFGQDAPGSYAFTTDNSSGGSKLGGVLSSNGVPVVVSVAGNTYSGVANGTTVFTLTLDPASGDYTYTQFEELDHADANDDNDVITLEFGVAASDSEGESVFGEIVINVKDDAAIANDDFNMYDVTNGGTDGNVITGLNGGPGAADNLSEDVPNTVTKISFGGNTVDVPQDGTDATIEGDFGILKINKDGEYTYEIKPGVTVSGTGGSSTLDPESGDVAGTQDSITKNGITVTSANGADLTWVAQDGAGIGIAGGGSNKVFPAGETLELTFDQNVKMAEITIADIGANNVNDGIDFAVYLASDPNTPIIGEVGIENLTIVDGRVVFTINADDYGSGAEIAQIDVFSTDAGQYGAASFLLHDVTVTYGGLDCIQDQFVYTLRDGDGDTDTAILDLKGKDLTDNTPVIVEPIKEYVDETFLGPITETGTVQADFFGEGPGTIAGNDDFSFDGSAKNGQLTSGGEEVVVTQVGDKYVGTADGTTVFELMIEADGDYTFKLYEPLDHADGNDDNDRINLNFGVVATDADGDTDTATITIVVKDDAPIANDDSAGVAEGGSVTGNVTNNDDGGEDTPATVVNVRFNGTDYPVPATGTTDVPGQYGTLTIAASGAFTYTVTDPNNPDGTDTFTYTLEDFDGDQDTAKLDVKVSPKDDVPVVVDPAEKTVDETALDGGPVMVSGTVDANYFSDTPGAITPNGDFEALADILNGNLTHNGVDIEVNVVGNSYVGTAGATTVFTLDIQPDGDFKFTLFENLDHDDPTRDNEVIELNFGVTATDSDGDTDTAEISIRVKDDVPRISEKFITIDESDLDTGPLMVTNAVSHDFGEDGPGEIRPTGYFEVKIDDSGTTQPLTKDGEPVTVTQDGNGYVGKLADGTVVLTLDINPQTGEYTYKQFTSVDHPDTNDHDDVMWLKFQVEIVDYDGDTDTTFIGIDLKDDGPVAHDDTDTVTETGGSTGGNVITNDDPGEDEPGSITNIMFGTNSKDIPEGGSVTISGTYGNLTIHSNGSYTYALTAAQVPDTGMEVFKYTLADADGDTDTAELKLNIIGDDDTPIVLDPAMKTVDETDFSYVGNPAVKQPLTVSGDVDVNYFNDTPGAITVNDDFTFEGSAKDGKLTSGGVDVVVNQIGDHTYSGTAGGTNVFTLTVQPDGGYKFTLFEPLDHDNPNDPDDTIQLNFGIKATDADGDMDTATIMIKVDDDGPSISDRTGAVSENDLKNGGTISITRTIDHDFGEDGPGDIHGNGTFMKTGSPDPLTSGGAAVIVTQQGNGYVGKLANGTVIFALTINPANGTHTYTQYEPLDHTEGHNASDNVFWLKFGVDIVDYDGDTDSGFIVIDVHDGEPVANDDVNNFSGNTANGNVITGLNGGPGAADELSPDVLNEIKAICFGVKEIQLTNGTATIDGDHGRLTIHSDGSYTYTLFPGAGGQAGKTFSFDPNSALVSGFQTSVTQDGITVSASADLVWLSSNIVGNPGIGVAGGASNTGKIYKETINIHFAEGVESVSIDASDIGTNNFNQLFTFQATFADGTTASIQQNTGQPGDGNVTFSFDNGDFGKSSLITNIVVTSHTSWLLADITAETPDTKVPVMDTFTYKLVDGDGDVSEATLKLNLENDVPKIDSTSRPVYEENLRDGGIIDVTRDISFFDFGNDGAGNIHVDGRFELLLKDNGTPQTLKSCGKEVLVTQNGSNGYVGKLADGTLIFTMTVHPTNGTYTYKQYEALDHFEGHDPADDVFWLKFGVEIVDSDGDTDTAWINVDVNDDEPFANTDVNVFDGMMTTGNVITGQNGGAGAADVKSADVETLVNQISFNGMTKAVSNGDVVINGEFGKLVIDEHGDYKYTLFDNSVSQPKETVYHYNVKNPTSSVSHKGGTIKEIDTTFNKTTNEFTFELVIRDPSGKHSDGFKLALNGGANPKGIPSEMAMLYFDASGSGEPIITVYSYNGENTSTSYKDGSPASGTQAPDKITSSLLSDSPFTSITETIDANGNRVFSFTMDASVIQNHNPLYGDASQWTGVEFGNQIGMWMHPAAGLQTSYGSDGYLTYWNADMNGYYDVAYKHAEVIEICPCEKNFEPDAHDIGSNQYSLTLDGITVSVGNPLYSHLSKGTLSWVDVGDGPGIGINGNGSNKVWQPGEVLEISFDEAVTKATLDFADIGSNDRYDGLDFKIYLQGQAQPVEWEFDIGAANPQDGVLMNVMIDSANFGGALIERIEVFSIDNSHLEQTSFLLNSVHAECPPEDVIAGTDTFEYQIVDKDGDTSSANLVFTNGESGAFSSTQNAQPLNFATFDGGSNDVLFESFDDDAFLYLSADDGGGPIKDSTFGEGSIDLSQLLENDDEINGAIGDFVFMSHANGDNTISADQNLGGKTTDVVTLDSTVVDLNELLGQDTVV